MSKIVQRNSVSYAATRGGEEFLANLGIGLAFVHQLLQLHGGEVEARPPGTGRGSESLVRLPAIDSALSVTASSRTTSQRHLKSVRRAAY